MTAFISVSRVTRRSTHAYPADLMKKGPRYLFQKVVKGMLPKNRLGDQLLRNLYVYAGSEHPHEAQQPKVIDINTLK